MAEYIERENVIKWIEATLKEFDDRWSLGQKNMFGLFRSAVEDNVICPAADVVERKKGKWELEPEYGWYICSACRDEVTVKSGRTNFCPNCGADLREGS